MGATNSSDLLGFDALFDPFPPIPPTGNQGNGYSNTGACAPYQSDARYCSNATAGRRCDTVSIGGAINATESRGVAPPTSPQWQQEEAKRKAAALNEYSFAGATTTTATNSATNAINTL